MQAVLQQTSPQPQAANGPAKTICDEADATAILTDKAAQLDLPPLKIDCAQLANTSEKVPTKLVVEIPKRMPRACSRHKTNGIVLAFKGIEKLACAGHDEFIDSLKRVFLVDIKTEGRKIAQESLLSASPPKAPEEPPVDVQNRALESLFGKFNFNQAHAAK